MATFCLVTRYRLVARQAAVSLRKAASEWAGALNAPVRDAHDSEFKRLDDRLKRAAVQYAGAATLAGMSKKRGYSREFTPQTDRRVRFEIDRIPPTLWDAVKAKAKREGISLRALVLSLLKEWVQK